MEHLLTNAFQAQMGQEALDEADTAMLAESDRMKDSEKTSRKHVLQAQDKVAKIGICFGGSTEECRWLGHPAEQ